MRPIRVARSAATCFSLSSQTYVVVCPEPSPVLYPYMEDSVKVAKKQGAGFKIVAGMVAVTVVAIAVLVGVGFIPYATASAQIAEAGPAQEAAPILPPVVGPSKIEGLRQPSGLGVEAQEVGTRTPTEIPKPAVVAQVRSARPAAVPASAGDGWKQAKVSWYGPGFYGNTMAGGGTLQTDSMVVAHKTLAFGTRIEFQYKGTSCVAVVMDRGPYTAGRTFDLGPGTARALGFSGVGTVDYRIISR